VSARNNKAHPRQEYLDTAIKVDPTLMAEVLSLRKEIAQLHDGVVNYALVADEQFDDLLEKSQLLDRFPITRRDFCDLVFYARSTTGLPGFQINPNRIEKDGQIEIIVPVGIKEKDWNGTVWDAVKSYNKDNSRDTPSYNFKLVYAAKKARLAGMRPKDIVFKLSEGTLPHYPAHRATNTSELNRIIKRAEKLMASKTGS
jgi:hypothetical protein